MTRRHGGARGTDHGKGMAIDQGGGPCVGQQEGNADVLDDFCLIVCIILSVQLFRYQICWYMFGISKSYHWEQRTETWALRGLCNLLGIELAKERLAPPVLLGIWALKLEATFVNSGWCGCWAQVAFRYFPLVSSFPGFWSIATFRS